MMETDDEDVIFENSVLHQALMNIGMDGVETEPRQQTELVRGQGGTDDAQMERQVDALISKRQYGLQLNFFIRLFFRPNWLEEMHTFYRFGILRKLISSELLTEEDHMFLCHFVEEVAPAEDPTFNLKIRWVPYYSILLLCVALVNVLGLPSLLLPWIHLYIDTVPYLSVLQHNSYTVSVFLVSLLCMLCVGAILRRLKWRARGKILLQLTKRNKALTDMETAGWELMYLERKCLRLIKESELVARGFTIASQHHLVFRLGHGSTLASSEHWCQELRKIMLKENIALMAEIKTAVVKMMKSVPMVCMDSDFNTLEVMREELVTDHERKAGTEDSLLEAASQGNDVLPSGDGPSVADDDKGQGGTGGTDKKTDVIPPASVSKSVDLLSVYMSGFVRRLALSFYQKNLRDQSINPYIATQECVETCRQGMERVKAALGQSYKFYRAINHRDDRPDQPQQTAEQRRDKQSQIYNLYICVNSLDLHLQSMLHATRDLTNTLEGRVDEERRRHAGMASGADKPSSDGGDGTTISAEDRELWEDKLKQLKASLDSCKGCYEESLKYLSQRASTEATLPNAAVREINPDNSQRQQQQRLVRMIPAEDPIIVDQVFEAMSEAVDEDLPDTRPRYTAEDRARLKEQRETMQRLRQELYAVVGHRAVSQREREERALARARGETLTDELPTPETARAQHLPVQEGSVRLEPSSHDNNLVEAPTSKREEDGDSTSSVTLIQGLQETATLHDSKPPSASLVDQDDSKTDGQPITEAVTNNEKPVAADLRNDSQAVPETDTTEKIPAKTGTGKEKKEDADNVSPSMQASQQKGKSVKSRLKTKVRERDVLQTTNHGSGSRPEHEPSDVANAVADTVRKEPLEASKGSSKLAGKAKPNTAVPDGESPKDVSLPAMPGNPTGKEESLASGTTLPSPHLKSALTNRNVPRSLMKPINQPGDVLQRHVEFEPGGVSDEERNKTDHWNMCQNLLDVKKDRRIVSEASGSSGISSVPTSSSGSLATSSTGSRGEPGSDVDFADYFNISIENDLSVIEEHDSADAELPRYSHEDVKINSGRNSPGLASCDPQEGVKGDGHGGERENLGVSHPPSRNSRTTSTSSSSSGLMKSQIICPKSIDPESAGFKKVGDRYVSRHNFTASERDNVLRQALYDIDIRQGAYAVPDGLSTISSHGAEMDASGDEETAQLLHDPESDKWVKISHHSLTTTSGNRLELLRQKDINLDEVLTSDHNPIPSPDPNSSFTKSIAMMAAARAKMFNNGYLEGEEFGDESSDSENENVNVE